MKVLVTGIDGYIGTILGQALIEAGHDVVGLDAGFYRSGWLYNGVKKTPPILTMDVRDVSVDLLRGFDAVVHLSELSNDPLGKSNPTATYAINHAGSVALATKAKAAGVSRFVYASSCSIYGIADGIVNESSPVSPQTLYAECKALVERDVTKLASDDFSPTFLRNATAYGASPRLRFDVVVNNLAGLAWTQRKIALTSDGTPWRPLIHIRDIAVAIISVLNAPQEIIHNQIFNVGNNDSNYQIKEIAETIADVFPGCELTLGASDGDNRSYRVSFDKIASRLPDFKCTWNVRSGAEELRELFTKIGLTAEDFENRAYTRLRALDHLAATGQLDDHFFWT
jgi:nucleoside-diphosphate-sugar epimerase